MRGRLLLGLCLFIAGAITPFAPPMPTPLRTFTPPAGTPAAAAEVRRGDEIVACGAFFHTGATVVLWTDPDGYDAYQPEPRFNKPVLVAAQPPPLGVTKRFNSREEALPPDQRERAETAGWTLPMLRDVVDQFVIHFDQSGTSRRCFEVLHDHRRLSVHFMLDLDGTIYQTLDLKERAWHATTANSRSIGVEIANIGAYAPGSRNPFKDWYVTDPQGRTRIRIPAFIKQSGIRNPDFKGGPMRNELVTGIVQGQELMQYDYTPQQYEALIKLTAALCRVFPKLRCDFPRQNHGRVVSHKLDDTALAGFQGVLGHFHVQANKIDPGPAFQWEYVIERARSVLNHQDTKTPRTD